MPNIYRISTDLNIYQRNNIKYMISTDLKIYQRKNTKYIKDLNIYQRYNNKYLVYKGYLFISIYTKGIHVIPNIKSI